MSFRGIGFVLLSFILVLPVRGEVTLGGGATPLGFGVNPPECGPGNPPGIAPPERTLYKKTYASLKDVEPHVVHLLPTEARQRRKMNFERLDPSYDGSVDLFFACDNDNPCCGLCIGALTAAGVSKDITNPLNGDDYGETYTLKAEAKRGGVGADGKRRWTTLIYNRTGYAQSAEGVIPGGERIQPLPILRRGLSQQKAALPKGAQKNRVVTRLGLSSEKEFSPGQFLEMGLGVVKVNAQDLDKVQDGFHKAANAVANFSRAEAQVVPMVYGKRNSIYASIKRWFEKPISYFDTCADFNPLGELTKLNYQRLSVNGGLKLDILGPSLNGERRIRGGSSVTGFLGAKLDWQKGLDRRAWRFYGGVEGSAFGNGAIHGSFNLGMQWAKRKTVWDLGGRKYFRKDPTSVGVFDGDDRDTIFGISYRRNFLGGQ